MHCSLKKIFLTASSFVLVCLTFNKVHADVVVSGFLTGPAPGVTINSLGSHSTGESIPFLGSYTNSAELAINDWDLKIKTATEFTGSPGLFGLQQASAGIMVNRTGQIAGQVSSPGTLVINGTFDGTVFFDPGTNHFHDGTLKFGDVQIDNLEGLFITDPGVHEIDLDFQTTVTVDADGLFDLEYGFSTDLFTRVGTNGANFFDTFEVTSILLPNGQTPESAGFTLTFDDGVASPNAIPEPNALLVIAGMMLVATAQRQRRKQYLREVDSRYLPRRAGDSVLRT